LFELTTEIEVKALNPVKKTQLMLAKSNCSIINDVVLVADLLNASASICNNKKKLLMLLFKKLCYINLF